MADEYTPTTAEICQVWVKATPVSGPEGRAEFTRWLAAHDHAVAAKALREFRAGFGRRFAFQDPYGHFDPSTVSALHRQVEGMLDAEADRIELQASERGASDGEQ